MSVANNFSTLPTSAEIGGDFSALLPTTVIYDPTTYDPATNSIQPFAGNIIPPERLNQGILDVLKGRLACSTSCRPGKQREFR